MFEGGVQVSFFSKRDNLLKKQWSTNSKPILKSSGAQTQNHIVKCFVHLEMLVIDVCINSEQPL